MILTQAELLSALRTEIRVLLHLTSKIAPADLDYRPSPAQRSVLELLQYLAILGPIHFRGALADSWSMDAWRTAWQAGQATAHTLDLAGTQAALAALPDLFAQHLAPCTEQHLRGELMMFGSRNTRGAWLVSLVLNHYAAYRMELFLYLKAAHPELNTLNLWAGVDQL